MSDKLQFGRKWRITVFLNDGETGRVVSDSTFGDNALRCRFEVDTVRGVQYWHAMVSIWNFNEKTENIVITAGMKVVIEAGYEDGNYGVIFKGSVFQPMFDRENVTDYITTLHCIDGLGLMDNNIANLTIQSGYDYPFMVASMAKNTRNPIPLGSLEGLDGKVFPRGRTMFGDPKGIIEDVASDNNAQWWIGQQQLEIDNMLNNVDWNPTEALVLTTENGLIGVPRQVQDGISFMTLLNPAIAVKRPLVGVLINNKLIRQQKATLGQPITPLDQDGLYQVIGVRFVGDTRGNEWYNEITAVNWDGKMSQLAVRDMTTR